MNIQRPTNEKQRDFYFYAIYWHNKRRDSAAVFPRFDLLARHNPRNMRHLCLLISHWNGMTLVFNKIKRVSCSFHNGFKFNQRIFFGHSGGGAA